MGERSELKDHLRDIIISESGSLGLSQDSMLRDYLLVCLELYNEHGGQWYESFGARITEDNT